MKFDKKLFQSLAKAWYTWSEYESLIRIDYSNTTIEDSHPLDLVNNDLPMIWGKHQGKLWEHILEDDPAYLDWAIDNCDYLWVGVWEEELGIRIRRNEDRAKMVKYFGDTRGFGSPSLILKYRKIINKADPTIDVLALHFKAINRSIDLMIEYLKVKAEIYKKYPDLKPMQSPPEDPEMYETRAQRFARLEDETRDVFDDMF